MRGPRLAAIGLTAILGCAAPRPDEVVAAYLRELAAGGDGARFVAAGVETSSVAPGAAAEALAAWSAAPATRAEVARGGRVVGLSLEAGEWRVAAGLPGLAPTDGPRAALAELRAAYAARDPARLARVTVFPPRELAALASRMAALEAALTDGVPPIAIDGDRATLSLAPHRTVRFVRVGGRWRVLDLE